MNKKQKILFRSSIFLNIVLVLFIVWKYINIHFASEQLFYTEVQDNLVELEGLIAHQKEDNWSEPNLVTTELGDVLEGIYVGLSNGKYLRTISNQDREVLEKLAAKLRQYPTDELYQFSSLTEQDQRNFEELQKKLRKAGLGLRITISNNWDSFMYSVKELENEIDVPLNK
ncbi:hypothetical protein [Neobacillus sp. D3-1R]|uniref:hypothetical protein n=1 Tax=Neobacillus sp. D3-1R TaxID=3445778 RepID=UPI003FA0EF23